MSKKKYPTKDETRPPIHPGGMYREISVPSIDVSKTDMAKAMGISRQHFYDLINEKKPFSPDTALRFAKYFGGSARVILKLQMEYDLWHAKKNTDVSKIPTVSAA